MEAYKRIFLSPNADGTFARLPAESRTEPSLDQTQPVLSKDIQINQSNRTFLRLFLPNQSTKTKLPLLIYFHGGGFVLCSPSSTVFHDYCSNAAFQLPAVVASVGYRLAPEHRLPAAFDDCLQAIRWIASTGGEEDPWLRDYADFGNCFLMGSSAGGNIAYHVALRSAAQVASPQSTEFGDPNSISRGITNRLHIRGVILHHAFFGGVERTESEKKMVNDAVLPLETSDLLWELSLPVGADRDHEYCNPMAGGGSKLLEKIRAVGWRVAVIGYEGDPLVDRQKELAKLLEEKGVDVAGCFASGGSHGLEIMDVEKGKEFNDGVLKEFLMSYLVP
ncbi:Carboxylesterase 1 [Linum grandiflorum]